MLTGTSIGASGRASPNLQAWYDDRKKAEDKRKQLEGDTGEKPQESLGDEEIY